MCPSSDPLERAFAEQQLETAVQLGYGDDVAAMNRDHDPLHRALCFWLQVPCVALPEAQPGTELAGIEEAAVLAVQKLMRAHGVAVPITPAAKSSRRHTDGSVTRAIAKTPRKVLEKSQADKTAQLRAEIAASEADDLAAQHGISDQLELLPPGVPARSALRGLPDPGSLYYSGAREA